MAKLRQRKAPGIFTSFQPPLEVGVLLSTQVVDGLVRELEVDGEFDAAVLLVRCDREDELGEFHHVSENLLGRHHLLRLLKVEFQSLVGLDPCLLSVGLDVRLLDEDARVVGDDPVVLLVVLELLIALHRIKHIKAVPKLHEKLAVQIDHFPILSQRIFLVLLEVGIDLCRWQSLGLGDLLLLHVGCI